jgi:hypothetical protein
MRVCAIPQRECGDNAVRELTDQEKKELVNDVRGQIATILIEASMGTGAGIPVGLVTVEDRLKNIGRICEDLMKQTMQLFPTHRVPEPIHFNVPAGPNTFKRG